MRILKELCGMGDGGLAGGCGVGGGGEAAGICLERWIVKPHQLILLPGAGRGMGCGVQFEATGVPMDLSSFGVTKSSKNWWGGIMADQR